MTVYALWRVTSFAMLPGIDWIRCRPRERSEKSPTTMGKGLSMGMTPSTDSGAPSMACRQEDEAFRRAFSVRDQVRLTSLFNAL